jgi:carboxymethylenebutenolidase
MFRAALDRFRKTYEIHMYEGAQHAFLNNPSGKVEANRNAAKKSVARTATWLKKTLP